MYVVKYTKQISDQTNFEMNIDVIARYLTGMYNGPSEAIVLVHVFLYNKVGALVHHLVNLQPEHKIIS